MIGTAHSLLLLSSHLGEPQRRPLSAVQLRNLTRRVAKTEKCREERELERSDLTAMGYHWEQAERILTLLEETDALEWYLNRASRHSCVPLMRTVPGYPEALLVRLGEETPTCLWARGDLSLLDTPMLSLVGNRDMDAASFQFAQTVGRCAALAGMTLVSGNARGADRAAQESCIRHGGRVVSVVADSLMTWEPPERMLYLSLEDYDAPFSAERAKERNRVIHAIGTAVVVAACARNKGGTWSGTLENLQNGWTPVFVRKFGGEVLRDFQNRGAIAVEERELDRLFGTLCSVWKWNREEHKTQREEMRLYGRNYGGIASDDCAVADDADGLCGQPVWDSERGFSEMDFQADCEYHLPGTDS